ncbi:glycoside hydrolase family 15 protein [Candidatus Woesearchaeota archaeon]|nr:glycoside hydrolase family 15 protein [Candidatus Woesearchaeota archaeon]
MDYGIIGNCHTCALVSKEASIDWFCYPEFSNSSVFAKILDKKKGGEFSIAPTCDFTTEQSYIKSTNVLETVFKTRSGSFKVTDFMPRYKRLLKGKNKVVKGNQVVRVVERLKGKPEVKVVFDPKPGYALREAEMTSEGKSIQVRSEKIDFQLVTNLSHDLILKKEAFKLDKPVFFAFGTIDQPEWFNMKRVKKLLTATRKYWQAWVGSLVLPDANKDKIIRSALVLKMLTYSKTGAIIAAATTSIPEEAGSNRCWDYRFCWVRDAAYTVDALSKIGRLHEAKKFMDFMLERVMSDDHLQIMYGIHGETKLVEYELDHLEGYMGSKPVRIGNAAYNQDQHDVYGELIDVIYLYYVYYEFENKMPKRYWRFLEWLVNQIRFNWDKRDSGIWEFRGSLLHFTYSKVMCWVGVDRAIKIAQTYGRDDLANKWVNLRFDIRTDVLKNGFSEEEGAFTMYYGGKELDASILHMTYHEFLESNDPRIISTVKKIYEGLRQGHLIQRYKMKDDFGTSKSAFTICSFWMIDSLIAIGELDKAKKMYGDLMESSNHLGLFSEDIDIATGKLMGNFPQAYTHIALINTSILLSEWSSKRKKIDWATTGRSKWF